MQGLSSPMVFLRAGKGRRVDRRLTLHGSKASNRCHRFRGFVYRRATFGPEIAVFALTLRWAWGV
jgi:hypothetical protein